MAEKQNIPEIRFEGFTDPWEQRKLEEVALVTMGQSPNGACYTDNPNDAVLVQGNADLKDGWVSPRVWTTEITKTAKAGDLIMSVRAPVGAMGKTAYDVVLGRGVAGIAGNEFLFQALSKKEAEGYWSTVSAGSTFDSINGDELRNTPVDYPRSKPEREAVGSCLSRIDCLITLHQRKYDKLCTVKKSMLDKMFPKPGETEPEIRFEGFTDPWEQREFGELYRPVSEKNDLSFGRDRVISVANMYFNPAVYVTEDSYLATYNVMRLGDIAFEGNRSKRFAHGRFVENTIGDGIVSHVFKVFRHVGDNYDLSYWKHAINNEKLMKDVLTRSTKASTMMHELVTADFLEESTLVPSLSEQRAIGAAIDSIDNLITLHQREPRFAGTG